MDKKALHVITFSLAMVGALNWGLVGLFDFNLVEALLGSGSGLARLVYIVVGVSAVYVFATHKNDCKICGEMMAKK
ncbi:hypothetical protein A2634_02455 [Candidatus Amesbacteria bacterium RIFCSPHIGHO2_01_FULL_48_32]|uniref:DUF378 domain-containing protein n=1 Tax=Candidatus Amesbacteria bacterium RIFCSPLOWO2_01_FULL_48_25 TaxID=1797259 RepID=A0A1F4ZDQ5_9BACT|nr:MAG: hypothetical protein A2634_02455 [Candidatus Amesbacteria bacterium RIFCSPHIGHO2_01_FULL_48_32]OGD04443.1 MAG: hypothetical protein A2989_05450 [Candidatus Amesbacteria bacterium RIFCSPLOWO2_01_FULL_48_25]HJZ06290.1 DUF378 domain-containing protein [Patescibacteria group bacterium]